MSIASFASSFTTLIVSAAVLATPVLAQDGGEGAATEKPSMLSDIVGNAGLIGAVIGILSIIALALVIEHFMSVKRDKLAPPHLIDEIEALFEEEKFQEAVEVCAAEPNFLTNTVGAGLAKLGHSFETIQVAFEEMHDEEEIKLHQKIGWLSLIAAVAPMLGLLGTVNGMIDTAYVFFKNRVVLASLEIGAIVEELFDRFRSK